MPDVPDDWPESLRRLVELDFWKGTPYDIDHLWPRKLDAVAALGVPKDPPTPADFYRSALQWISQDSLPDGASPVEFAFEDGTEDEVRLSLYNCIRLAREILTRLPG
jgi:hypothetical protein